MNLLGVVTFGEPRPGFIQLADILAPYPNRSYRNNPEGVFGHDLVTDVPAHAPPEFPYVHGGECGVNPRHLIDIDGPPTDPLDLTPFRWHHTYLYLAGMLKLDPLPVTLLSGATEGVTDLDCLNLCGALYGDPAFAPVAWDHLDEGADDGIHWAAKRVGGIWVVCNRGTKNLQDTFRDIRGYSTTDPKLGPLEAGFAEGAPRQAAEVLTLIGGDPVLFTGHSLGGARAQIQAGYAVTGP